MKAQSFGRLRFLYCPKKNCMTPLLYYTIRDGRNNDEKRFYKQEESFKSVNIFHKRNYCVTTSLSAYCKTYCFAFQKRLFCKVKRRFCDAKSRFRNAKPKLWFFLRTIFTKQGRFLGFNGAVFGFNE